MGPRSNDDDNDDSPGGRYDSRRRQKEDEMVRLLAEVFGARGNGGTFASMQTAIAELQRDMSDVKTFKTKTMTFAMFIMGVCSLVTGVGAIAIEHWLK